MVIIVSDLTDVLRALLGHGLTHEAPVVTRLATDADDLTLEAGEARPSSSATTRSPE
jgi:hypothetical protein